MTLYIGQKIIKAFPMTRGEYNDKRQWVTPINEEESDDGYNVFYPDGYESWSPKETFEKAYREVDSNEIKFMTE